uniref:DUF3793 family protein n=1 Tax=Ndongobacter massiliensis TaxID=1871025 RepID=UPI000A965B1C|nr:DUF3793 family protein [Ndongobacter massiliensis]
MTLEHCLITHAAPTLAGLKVGNLLCVSKAVATKEALRQCCRSLWDKGISITPLRLRRGRILLYVFRPKQLQEILERKSVRDFLQAVGYEKLQVPGVLGQLRLHFRSADFPHEIGIFLGYPVEDVRGFIEHCGANCKYCGEWKVYGDVESAKRTFEKFRKCRGIYRRCYQSGFALPKLAVAM